MKNCNFHLGRLWQIPSYVFVLSALVLQMSLTSKSEAQSSVVLLGQIAVPGSATDVWGYVDSTSGKEYAVVGSSAGVTIVDVTNPAVPVQVASISSVPGFDVKVWRHYVYSVTGGGGTNQGKILDISDPSMPQVVGSFNSSHNIFISGNGFMFAESPGLKIYDLNQDPISPMLLWDDGTGGGHDASVIGNRLFDFHGSSGTNIYDVNFSNPFSVQLLGSINDPAISYHHSGWTAESGQYLFICDELSNHPSADITAWDISDPGNPQKVSEFADPTATVHNLYVVGDFAYVSYYSAGFRVFDVGVPSDLVMVGEYDTSPSSGQGFSGAFGVYPFAPSGNIYVSDRGNGLFIFEFDGTQAHYRLYGTLKDSISGIGIENGWLEILESGLVERSDSSGNFRIASAAGVITLRAAAFGYQQKEIQLTAIPGAADTLEISLQPAEVSVISGTITNRSGNPIEGLSLRLLVNSALFDDPLELGATTNINGQYVFDSLFVSDSAWVSYERLTLEQLFPYASSYVDSVTVTSGLPSVLDFQLDPADILLVNDDPSASYMSIYRDALATLGIIPFEWTTATEGDAIPVRSINQLNHDLIVWFTGDAVSDVISTTEQDSIAYFLDSGGQLFLTGQNIADYLNGQGSQFLQDYLDVAFGGKFVGLAVVWPVSSNPVSGSLNSFLVIQSSSDIINPITNGNADSAFTYEDGSGAGVTVRDQVSGSKVVFLGYGFEDIQAGIRRRDLMASAFNWFEVVTNVESTSDDVPKTFVLKQNYPNPFNPSTTIAFSLPRSGYTTLKVYDMLGKEVATLVADDLSAGTYSVTWNPIDVASGVYIYRMISGGNSIAVRKMMVLH